MNPIDHPVLLLCAGLIAIVFCGCDYRNCQMNSPREKEAIYQRMTHEKLMRSQAWEREHE